MTSKIYLDLPEVAAQLSLSTATVQRLSQCGDFPKPRMLSGRRVAWLYREVLQWAEARPVSHLLPPSNGGNRSAVREHSAAGAKPAPE
ncbi:MAG: AlpA family phage regulatory protein [Rubrivivax sp.]|nr:MAG: AlpA family phage regulatory protein [Rubrivivax sp.]